MVNEGVIDFDEIVEDINRNTSPGKSNQVFVEETLEASSVIQRFINETNDWFEINQVKIERNREIDINCLFRWTIISWSNFDMDDWLRINGWDLIHHTRADAERHYEDNMIEARYKKKIKGYDVYTNFMVLVTDEVFEKLNKSGDDFGR